MARIIIPSRELIINREIKISGQEAHYLLNVLRLNKGEIFQILNGKGNIYTAEIISLSKKEIIAKITSAKKTLTESPLFLILVQAILKSEKMDYVIQKATELGVKEIYPVITSRTVIRKTDKYKRWLRIIQESVKQCGRTEIPIIQEPLFFEEFLNKSEFNEASFKGFIFYEGAKKGLKELSAEISGLEIQEKKSHKLYCITGPEGGFSERECELASSKGFIPVSLGPRILRAETASVTALSLLQFIYGDLS